MFIIQVHLYKSTESNTDVPRPKHINHVITDKNIIIFMKKLEKNYVKNKFEYRFHA